MGRPSGTVTFLFSDIVGSTRRWERDSEAMSAALQRHDTLMRESIEAHGGYVFKIVGDAFCAAFALAPNALAAAVHAQRALAADDFSTVDGLRVRMAMHTGIAEERGGDYFGQAVNRVARLLALGHGGQVLVSGTAADLLRDALPPQHGLRDLGLHGLKDLSRGERVFQVLAPELDELFPSLRSLDRLPNNLPVQLTSFVGREQEVAEVKSLFAHGPLVTLTGPGGVGKTRCALQAAAEMLEGFGDGVWLIDLSPIADAAVITSTIATTLGVREAPNRPLLETLVEYLAPRAMLLILDNCEHVINETRTATVEILRHSLQLRILATSREPFNVSGEQVLRLPSLAAPDSAALFADRARLADPRFSLTQENEESVGAIAARLDGMPLAIELAAARVRVLSPTQIARHLDERFRMLTGGDRSALPRHQTLRATIDWSYDLLEQRERALFRRLTIFAGSFDVTAATDVCSAAGELDEWDVLDALTALVDKSLVLVEAYGDERRYRLLQSVREYGRERLRGANEEASAAERHARYYAGFAANLQPLVDELEDEEWKRRCIVELDNFRAAFDWAIVQKHDPATGIALLAHLEWPEIITSPQEALRWYERAAEEAAAMPSDVAHARILRHKVLLQWVAGRPLAERLAAAQRELDVARRSGEPNEIARALSDLGACYQHEHQFDEAVALFAEAYVNPDRLSRITRNSVLRIWSVTELQRGNLESARERFLDAIHCERAGSIAHASALLNLGELEYMAGNVAAARDAARSALGTYAALDSAYVPLALANLGAYALAANDLEDARNTLRDALASGRSGRWMTNILEDHALLAALQGDSERAALLLGFTDARYRDRGEDRPPTEHRGYQRLSDLLKAAFDDRQLERLTSSGARLHEEEVLEAAAAISSPRVTDDVARSVFEG